MKAFSDHVRATGDATVRPLTDADLPFAQALTAAAPVPNVFVGARLLGARSLSSWQLGAELWGFPAQGPLTAICWSGANLVPVQADRDAARAFAERARQRGRVCSSLVGPGEAIAAMWSRLSGPWGPARDERLDQPLLALGSPPLVAPDPAVRRAEPGDIDALLPACVAMYTEEVGVSPIGHDGGTSYRARVTELVRAGHAFVRTEDGEVVFKAELGAVSPDAVQVQGVWTHPDHRGEGIGTAGMAAVVAETMRSVAPIVSLYVNGHNLPARAVYEKVGFSQVGWFASILF